MEEVLSNLFHQLNSRVNCFCTNTYHKSPKSKLKILITNVLAKLAPNIRACDAADGQRGCDASIHQALLQLRHRADNRRGYNGCVQ